MRNILKTSWYEASERTQRRHVRKAKQALGAVLDEVAPARSGDLWKALVASKPLSSAEESDQEDVDVVLMQALGECYANAFIFLFYFVIYCYSGTTLFREL